MNLHMKQLYNWNVIKLVSLLNVICFHSWALSAIVSCNPHTSSKFEYTGISFGLAVLPSISVDRKLNELLAKVHLSSAAVSFHSRVWCIKPIFQWQTCWWWQTTYLLEVGVHKTFLPCIWQISRFAGVKFLKRFQLVDNLLGPAKAKSCKIGVHKTFDLPWDGKTLPWNGK